MMNGGPVTTGNNVSHWFLPKMAPPPHVARANGMKGGRPPMAPNRLSRKRAMELCAKNESPLDIMFDNMLFWHRQSRDLGAKLDAICGKIKNEDDRREAMSLARMLLSARENAQRCAVDCAPYVHAKLQAVHHEHGPTGRYLISDKEVGATVIDVTPEDE